MNKDNFFLVILIFVYGLVTTSVLGGLLYLLGYSLEWYMREINTLQRILIITVLGVPPFLIHNKKLLFNEKKKIRKRKKNK